jgi:hypothetical protein
MNQFPPLQLSPTTSHSVKVLRSPVARGYADTMGYWVKRIILKDGEVVTERELREDENRFDGPAPAIGDMIEVQCRGRKLMAEVVWSNPPGCAYSEDTVVPLRVSEVGLDPTTPLRFPKPGATVSQE